MADLNDLTTRLSLMFPQETAERLQLWIGEAVTKHKYQSITEVPETIEETILAFSKYFGISAKSLENADKGSISVQGKVDINKSQVSQNYQRMIKQAWREYKSEALSAGITPVGTIASSNSIVRRSDGR